jgi:hypothetical protein
MLSPTRLLVAVASGAHAANRLGQSSSSVLPTVVALSQSRLRWLTLWLPQIAEFGRLLRCWRVVVLFRNLLHYIDTTMAVSPRAASTNSRATLCAVSDFPCLLGDAWLCGEDSPESECA